MNSNDAIKRSKDNLNRGIKMVQSRQVFTSFDRESRESITGHDTTTLNSAVPLGRHKAKRRETDVVHVADCNTIDDASAVQFLRC